VYLVGVGVFVHENLKLKTLAHHGKKAKSFLKYGLQLIANILLNPCDRSNFDIFYFLSCT
jgi:hypothetical protein